MKKIFATLFLLSIVVLNGCMNNIEKSKKAYDEGVVALKEGKKDEADKFFKKAIELDPNNSKAMFELGFMHYEEAKPDDIEVTIGYLKKACELDPNNEKAHYALGMLYGEKGMGEHEVDELMKTVALNNDNVDAHYNLGVIYTQKGVFNEAEKEFNEVLRINPKDKDAMLNLGIVYFRNDLIENAVEIVGRLKELSADDADKLNHMMLTSLTEAVTSDPKDPIAAFKLGVYYFKSGMTDKVAEIAKTLKGLDKVKWEEFNNLTGQTTQVK